MKKNIFKCLTNSLIIVSLLLTTSCLKNENPIKYPDGTFPDTIINMADLNSEYDDYNLSIYSLEANSPLVFSSNRKSAGGQFDLVQGLLSYAFDQSNGTFWFGVDTLNDPFLTYLLSKVNTAGNEFGPSRLYSSLDGYEYMIFSSDNTNGNLDFYYTMNLPYQGNSIPPVSGPYPVLLLNSASNDAYITFNTDLDSAYFSSDANGNFDIYLHEKPTGTNLNDWLNLNYEYSSPVDNFNGTGDDKCPYLIGKVMVFASDRSGGLGGFDLYYSLLKGGEWGLPVNLGSPINTEWDEYRPVIGGNSDFTNNFLMFSSNKPGGKGGFDLYFTGIELPK